MAARPSWKGYLKLSLVSCPVNLYPATTSTEKISFNLLHKDTLNRVRMVPTDPELGPVDRADLVKGYPVDKDRYIVVEDDELAALQIESSKTIDVEGFADPASIGPLWLDAPYYVAPDGGVGAEAFAVIREAMTQSGKTGLARVTIGTRERLCAMTPCDGGLMLFTLREAKEVRQPSEVFGELEQGEVPSGEMLDLALEIVRRKTVEFDPTTYEDRYQKALRELIQAKLRGATPVAAKAAPEPGKVINIMDALRRSLEQSKAARPANDHVPSKPAPKKRKTKKSDARQRSMLLPLAGGAKGEGAAKPARPAAAAKRKRA